MSSGDHFGQRLKAARVSKGLTQQGLADAVGCVKSTVRNYERMDRLPPDRTFVKGMEHVLGVRLQGRGRGGRNTRVDDADVDLLFRALTAKYQMLEQARATALPLVRRLALGEYSTSAERDRMASQIEAALTNSPAFVAPDAAGSDVTPDEAIERDASVDPYGGPFGISGSNGEPSTGDAAKPGSDSAQG